MIKAFSFFIVIKKYLRHTDDFILAFYVFVCPTPRPNRIKLTLSLLWFHKFQTPSVSVFFFCLLSPAFSTTNPSPTALPTTNICRPSSDRREAGNPRHSCLHHLRGLQHGRATSPEGQGSDTRHCETFFLSFLLACSLAFFRDFLLSCFLAIFVLSCFLSIPFGNAPPYFFKGVLLGITKRSTTFAVFNS